MYPRSNVTARTHARRGQWGKFVICPGPWVATGLQYEMLRHGERTHGYVVRGHLLWTPDSGRMTKLGLDPTKIVNVLDGETRLRVAATADGILYDSAELDSPAVGFLLEDFSEEGAYWSEAVLF